MSSELLNTSFVLTQIEENSHKFSSYYQSGFERYVGLFTDLHWDNPKSDHDLIKKDFDLIVKLKGKIIINGDLFCLMQGKGDPRGNKSDVRPEHQVKNYLDSVVDTAIEFFGPYANHIAVIGRGNHEEGVRNRQETDILKRFVDGMNLKWKPDQYIQLGGYGGWCWFHFNQKSSRRVQNIRLKYYHGTGGGGATTHGMPQSYRRQAQTSGADIIWSGHIHEHLNTVYPTESIDAEGKIQIKETEHIVTATYKEEYMKGRGGWHVQRGGAPKPLRGGLLRFYYDEKKVKFEYHRLK